VSALRLLLLGGVGLVTGAVNTVAGGGSLLSFPTLLALGYSPLVANVTNTVGVLPSSAGGAFGYRRELVGQGRHWVLLAAISTVGSVLGAWLLLVLPASAFEAAVPLLIGTAALLTLVQPWLARHVRTPGRAKPPAVPTPVGPRGPGTTAPGGGPGRRGGALAGEGRATAPPAVRERWPLLVAVLFISLYGAISAPRSGCC